MNDTLSLDYQIFHQRLVSELLVLVKNCAPFVASDEHAPAAEDLVFVSHLDTLSTNLNASEQGYPLGQWVITTIIARYPHLTTSVPRDLFWFFGGDCLHYLGEEEIVLFQRLDESYHVQDSETEVLQPYETMRMTIFGLH